jgi:hypothetical protein
LQGEKAGPSELVAWGFVGAPLADEPGLSTFASATSFHRQIFPDETLSFGFSASAMHWLSAKPGVIADHVHAAGASESERALYRKQALSDRWRGLDSQAIHRREGVGSTKVSISTMSTRLLILAFADCDLATGAAGGKALSIARFSLDAHRLPTRDPKTKIISNYRVKAIMLAPCQSVFRTL